MFKNVMDAAYALGRVRNEAEAAELEFLDLVTLENVASLKDISLFPRLRCLRIGLEKSQSLAPLASLVHLEEAFVGAYRFTDFTGLSALPKLRVLTLIAQKQGALPKLEQPVLKELNAHYCSVTSVEALACPALQVLKLGQNKLASLDFLAGVPRLEALDLHGVPAKDWSPVSALPALKHLSFDAKLKSAASLKLLNLSVTRLYEMPEPGLAHAFLPYGESLGDLAAWSSLRSLALSHEALEDHAFLAQLKLVSLDTKEQLRALDVLPTMPELHHLRVAGDLLSLEGLERFASLRTLEVTGSTAPDLGPLARMPNLLSVSLGRCLTRDLSPLAHCTSLRALSLHQSGGGQLGLDLSPLAGLNQLAMLTLTDAGFEDVTPLAKLPLRSLNIARNKVASLSPLASLKGTLQQAWVEGNPCTDRLS